MIPINKPSAAPAALRNRGRAAARVLRNLYDAAPAAYESGAQTFEFDNGIYAHESVKQTLRDAQHDKCAFCESHISHTGYGDIEHFRPKAGYRQRADDPLGRPGYYWLAYEWSNLLLSCQLCNQRFKRNLFPLRRVRRRALSHHHDVTREEPLLIEPSSEDPDEHLTFRAEIVVPVRRSRKGSATIEVLGLNREELAEYRRERLERLRLFRICRDMFRQLLRQMGNTAPSEVRARLAELEEALGAAVLEQAEYAAMSRAYLG